MKKTLIAVSLLAFASASAMATGSGSTQPDFVLKSTGGVTNSVSTSSGGYAQSTGTGASTAYATNTQKASGWTSGSGDLSAYKTSRIITLEDCEPTKVYGTVTKGNVYSAGGSTVSGVSFAKTTGDAQAQAIGASSVLVQGATTLTSDKINLDASGFSANSIVVDSGVVSGDASSKAYGSTGSGFEAYAKGEVFEYKSKDGSLVGDNKVVTSGGNAYTGQTFTYVPGNKCQPGKCLANDAVAVNGTLGNVELNSQAGFGSGGTVQVTVGTVAP